jgi:hypothetical protein
MTDTDPVVLGALDRASTNCSTPSGVAEQLTREASELDPTTYDAVHLDALRVAIGFWLLPDGTFSGEYAGTQTPPWPRTLDQISPDALLVWVAYADTAAAPAVRAHLHRLLAAARAGSPHLHARAAISAYRDAVPVFLATETVSSRVRATESLVSALGLARGMNQKDLIGPVATDIITMADMS